MDYKKVKKLLWQGAVAYWILAVLIFVIAGEHFRFTLRSSDSLQPSMVVGEITDGIELTQTIIPGYDRLDFIELYTGTYARENTGILVLDILDGDGARISGGKLDADGLPNGAFAHVVLDTPIECKDAELTLRITSRGCSAGNAVTLYAGTAMAAGKFSVEQTFRDGEMYVMDGQRGAGALCLILGGGNYLNFYKLYWPIVTTLFALAVVYVLLSWRATKQGKNTLFVALGLMMTKYRFLIRQLVGRDFKIKYKRSVLGVAWSFLNPLLTMLVQYIVFSTLFSTSIANFPVYLLTGTVFFGFFNEATNVGLFSILGNASLIKKVYVPKYIYPFSKVLSSLVNFSLALLPLMLVVIITGTPLTWSMLLLIFDILCFLCFISGMVLILSTMMVFFQDTQFLWSVASTLWMYMTPIFYPESIIPAKFLSLYHLNPLYQYITFARVCIIDGISPQPNMYLGCLLPAVVFLVIGGLIFRKKEDRFIMYL